MNVTRLKDFGFVFLLFMTIMTATRKERRSRGGDVNAGALKHEELKSLLSFDRFFP